MPQDICEYIHNYFVPLSADVNTYTVAGGMISPAFGAEDGDRFLICGSRRNDGVYTWHPGGIKDDDDSNAAGLRDETFAGTIRVCSIPPVLLALSGEIKAWVDANSAALSSPYQSESFNGYSYTLKSGGTQGGGSCLTWRDQYGKQLERWRRPFI